jgi:tRNA threonylcarbamoyladenosine biosynthesis protein TsaB
MKILSINTSHSVCSVAISDEAIIIAEKTEPEANKQAERLVPIINQLLLDNNLKYADISAIAADIGPGSFTGVRIGLAAARGIALAAKIPLIGVTSLEALAHQAKSDNLLVVFDARRGQIFVQLFNKNEAGEPLMIDYADIKSFVQNQKNLTIIGDGAHLIEPFLKESGIKYSIIKDLTLPDSGMVALCAYHKFQTGDFSNNPAPLYIRPPDAKLPGGITPA